MSSCESIVEEALKIAPPARAAFLDRACSGQPELRAEVEALLAARAATETLPVASAPSPDVTLTSPSPGLDVTGDYSTKTFEPTLSAAAAKADRQGTVIGGRYTLVETIGEGGMGSVFRADQTEPVKRQVAVKLIKVGMDSRAVLARFDAERQALALMDHPNIARIFDGGVTAAGQPYFVMELVRGVPLTQYCDERRLPVKNRLELFIQVCLAVQHAHQKGIIHRDLKPGNILVTEVDGRPTPKVIDFGVAKATEQKLTDQTFSDTGAIVGTPAYMSPEQADPSMMDIDTRSDVYSLGVILYELLVGSPPIDAKQLKRGAILEMLRMVREVEPPRPSTKLSTAEALPNIAANRNIDPAKLTVLLRGELDWVVMKALEKDRSRRYETANGFARDLQRYLADEVVEARPPSRGYRLRKFIRRNRGQVIAASLVFAALLAGFAGTAWGMWEAQQQTEFAKGETAEKEKARAAEADRANAEQRERIRAEGAEADAKAKKKLAEDNEREAKDQLALAVSLATFLQNDILAQASARLQARQFHVPKPNLTIREALDRASKTVGTKFADRPRIEASIRHTMGVSYREVSAVDQAIEQLERALALRKQTLGDDHDDTLLTMNELSESYNRANRVPQTIAIREAVLDQCLRKHGEMHVSTETARHNLAAAYHAAGRMNDAIRLYEKIRDQRQKEREDTDPSLLATLNNLATVYSQNQRRADALKIYEEIHDRYVRINGPENPDSIMLISSHGSLLVESGQEKRGLKMLEEASQNALKYLGRERYETMLTRNNLAEHYLLINRAKEALAILEETRADATRILGPEHAATLVISHNLAKGYMNANREEDAIKLMEQICTIRETKFGIQHPETIKGYQHLGFFNWLTKHYDRGAAAFEKALEGARKQWGERSEQTLSCAINLSFNYRDNKQPDKAGEVLREWLPRAMEITWTDTGIFRAGLDLGINLNILQGRREVNPPLIKRLLGDIKKNRAKNDVQYAGELAMVGLTMIKSRMPVDAEPVLRESLALREKLQPTAWTTFNTQSVLGGALLGQKKNDEAGPLLLKGYEGMVKVQKTIPATGYIRLAEALDRLIEWSTATGKTEDAERYKTLRKKFDDENTKKN